jgi:hydroxypyruvate isomerase
VVRFCPNLSMLYTEVPFLDRFERARAAGFSAVEFQFPYDHPTKDVGKAIADAGVEVVLFNMPAGDFAAGDRGMANDPARTSDFQNSLDLAMEYAAAIKPMTMNCMAGKTLTGVPLAEQRQALIANLRLAANAAGERGIRMMTEPLNPYDAPGFFLPKPSDGFSVVKEAAHPNLAIEYDIYHAQRTEGNIVTAISENLGAIGHIQIADCPARNEPGTGELNWRFIFDQIDTYGYSGWVGLEYKPSGGDTDASLAWMEAYRV